MRRLVAGGSALLAVLLGIILSSQPASATSAYDRTVLRDSPLMYLSMASPHASSETDLTGNGHSGTYAKGGVTLRSATLPNGEAAADFNGTSQYLTVLDSDALSINTTGRLTWEAWIRPDSRSMPKQEGSGYVMWLGKGAAGNYEWANRMYQTGNTEGRANRISGYAFNLSGGLGVGAYFQDTVSTSRYMLVTLVVDTKDRSLSPNGLIRIYKNGVLRQSTGLTQSYAKVNPENGTAPFRIGTRDLASYFQGVIAKVAVWPTALTSPRVAAHYSAMCPSGRGTPGCS